MKSSSLAPMTVHNQDGEVDFHFQKLRYFWISIVWVTSTVFPEEGIEFIIYSSWLAGDSGAPNNTEKYTSPSPKSKHSILTHSSFTVILSSLNATAKIVDARKSWTVDITWQKCTCKRRMQRCHSALFPKMLMAALELLLLKRLNGMFGHQCHVPNDLQEQEKRKNEGIFTTHFHRWDHKMHSPFWGPPSPTNQEIPP